MIQSLNTDTDDLMDPKRRGAKDKLDGVEEEEVSWRCHVGLHYSSTRRLRVGGHLVNGHLFVFSILLV